MLDLDQYDRQVLYACLDYAAAGVRPTVAVLHEGGLGSCPMVGGSLQRLERAGYLLRERYSNADGSWTHMVTVAETSGLC